MVKKGFVPSFSLPSTVTLIHPSSLMLPMHLSHQTPKLDQVQAVAFGSVIMSTDWKPFSNLFLNFTFDKNSALARVVPRKRPRSIPLMATSTLRLLRCTSHRPPRPACQSRLFSRRVETTGPIKAMASTVRPNCKQGFLVVGLVRFPGQNWIDEVLFPNRLD